MSDPFYTLQSNGLAVRSDTGTISTEWWTQSPTEVESIGVFFQVMATVTRAVDAEATGVFGEWLSLSENQTWGIDTNGDEAGGASVFLQIRSITDTDTILATATIDLGLFLPDWTLEPLYTFVYAPSDLAPLTTIRFGWVVAMARSAKDRIACTATSFNSLVAGEILVYLRNGDRWDLEYREAGTSDQIMGFSDMIWMNNDGTIMLSTDRSGTNIALRYYSRSDTTWTLQQTLDTGIAANPGSQGPLTNLCASSDGARVAVWGYNQNELRVYKLANNSYSSVFSLTTTVSSSEGLAISRDGLRLAFNITGTTLIYEDDGSDNWTLLDTITHTGLTESANPRSVDLNSTGKLLMWISLSPAQSTLIYEFDGANYALQSTVTLASTDTSPKMASMASHGLTTAVCGATGGADWDEGLTHIIQSDGTNYSQVRSLVAPTDQQDSETSLMSNDGSINLHGVFNNNLRTGIQVYEATGIDETTGLMLNDNQNGVNMGSTVDSTRQVATILGTEPSNGAVGTCYTSFSMQTGQQWYVEFSPLVIINSGQSSRCGFQREVIINPSSPFGSGTGSIGIEPGGDIALEGILTTDGPVFGVGDIIGIAVDKRTSSVTVDIYLNNVFVIQKTLTVSTAQILVPGITLGINTEIGQSWQVFTSALNQNFTPPTGFVPIEQQVL